jgi:Putative metallopeptidase
MCVSKTLLVAGGVALFELVGNSAAADDYRSNRIRIEYVVPKNPQHQPIYDTLQKQKALEKLQEIFAAFQLPIDLTLRTTGCGFTNAWYQEDVITVCYEYLDHINKNAPKEVTEAGLTPDDAIAGQFFYAFAHEMGHAAFDLLSVPNFGGQEDAADRFGAYVILHLGPEDAKRLIMGAAYGYRPFMEHPTVNVPLKVFSDGHNPPPERYYNLLCIAYGAHPELFAEVVTKNLLPEQRAARCRREYGEVNYAFQKTVSPHVDQEIAKRVMQREWLPEVKTTHRSK